MTPEQCRELAEYHEHMANWCGEKYMAHEGMLATIWKAMRRNYRESARYWREKADG